MNIQHTDSLFLVWRIAQIEAQKLKASNLEPTHLALALAKIVDVDFTELVPKGAKNRDAMLEELLREARRLRTIFQVAGLNSQEFRRLLRRSAPAPRFPQEETETLHRSAAAKKVFSEAEQFVQLSGEQQVYPVHLLLAVLIASDDERDGVLLSLGVKKKRLIEIAKREIFTARPTGFSLGGDSKRGRN